MKTVLKIRENYFSFQAFAVLSLIVLIFIIYLNHAIRSLTFPFPLEYGEGIVANYVIRVLNGQSIYPDFIEDSYIFLHNPYGPLFFYVSAIFAKFFSNPFLSGRLLSLLSFFSIIVFLYLNQNHSGFPHRDFRRNSSVVTFLPDSIQYKGKMFLRFIFAIAFFSASPIVWRYSVMARVDFFALAITAYSLYFLNLSEREENDNFWSRRTFFLFLSGILSGLAFLVKPLYCISALTGTVVTFRSSTRHFAKFASGLMMVMVVFFFWLFISGSDRALFVHWTKLNLIGLSFANFARLFFLFLRSHPFCFMFFVVSLYKFREEYSFWYFALFSGLLALFALKNGAMESYFLPLLLSSSIGVAKFASWLLDNRLYNYFLYACLAVQLGIFLPVSPKPVFSATYGFEIPDSASVITPGEDDIMLGKALLEEIRNSSGVVLCDDPGYLLPAGKQIFVQPYQYGMLAIKKIINTTPLKEKISEGFFSLCVIRAGKEDSYDSYFPGEIINMIKEKYNLKTKIGIYEIYE